MSPSKHNIYSSTHHDFPSCEVSNLGQGEHRPTIATATLPQIQFDHPRRVLRICERCAREFWSFAYQVARGRGRFCSPSCASSATMLRRWAEAPMLGSANPGWKGGVSRDHVRYKNRFRAKFPEKAAAHDAVSEAIRTKRLVRPATCGQCGAPRPHAHHDDYSKPLAVRWLCRTCHREADRQRRLTEAA